MRFCLLLFLFVFLKIGLLAQDTCFIKIHFWYGSKPARGFKKSEMKYFGGIHGGHVTVEIGDTAIGFNPNSGARVFAKKNHSNGKFHLESSLIFTYDSTDDRQSTVIIPVTADELSEMRYMAKYYLNNTPYDYAFFGMRCAAAAHEFLSIGGIFKKRTKFFSIFYNFYPKKLRKRVYDLAFEKGYEIIYQDGRKERKWENDKLRHRKKMEQLIKTINP